MIVTLQELIECKAHLPEPYPIGLLSMRVPLMRARKTFKRTADAVEESDIDYLDFVVEEMFSGRCFWKLKEPITVTL